MSPVLIYEELRFPAELLSAMLLFLLPFSKKKPRFISRAVMGFCFFTLLSLLYFPVFQDKMAPRFLMAQGPWYFFFAVYPVFYAKLCFEIGWCDALFLSISAFATQNIVYVVLHEFLARSLFPGLREHLILYILLSILLCALVYAVVYRVFARHLARCQKRLFQDSGQNALFYIFLFLLMIFCLFYYQNLFENYETAYSRTAWMMGFSFNIFLLTIQYSLFRTRSFATENELLEQMLRNNEHYYDMAREHIAIINRKCHDLKHQLKVLSQVSEEERQAYIAEAQKSIIFYQQLVHSENDVINTILAEKGLFCEEHDIDLSCAVDDVNLDFIRISDLYAILGNAIDNAIEYVEQFDEPKMRVINFRISHTKQFLSIQVNNPYLGPALPDGQLPKSSKPDDAYHGFGLKSIRYLAEKYHGGMEISTSDHMFTLQIVMPTGEDEGC